MSYEEHSRNFEKELLILGRRFDLSRVFNDLLTMGMCSVHQINIASRLQQKDEANEALYMQTIKPYSKEELLSFGKILAEYQLGIYKRPYSDMLGGFFTEHITQGHNGQFFTPDSVCELMARTLGADESVTGQRVYDPACGSGRLMLAFAKVSPDNHFFANDVSMTCAKMTSLNFMFNGLRGEVACMNTLSMEWISGWRVNTPVLGIVPIEKEQSQIWTAPPKPSEKGKQLILF